MLHDSLNGLEAQLFTSWSLVMQFMYHEAFPFWPAAEVAYGLSYNSHLCTQQGNGGSSY